jgi:hypothetical protein
VNLYFLLEGKRTEPKIYPKWLSYLLPNCNRVFSLKDIKSNNYIIFSGMGYPSILNHIKNSIKDFQNYKDIDYLIISVDCEEDTPAKRLADIESEINKFIDKKRREKILVILQNRCIETWLLGNTNIFVRNPQDDDLKKYISHYNVYENDPEQMGKYKNFNTTSQFHFDYLKKMLKEKNISYAKHNPSDTAEAYYLEQLIKRVEKTSDLKSFKFFLETIEKLKKYE